MSFYTSFDLKSLDSHQIHQIHWKHRNIDILQKSRYLVSFDQPSREMLQLFAQISACEHKKDIRKCQEFEMISKRVSPRHEKISPEFAGVSACHAKTSKHFAGASACHEKTAEHFRLSLSSARKNINILRESQFVRKIIGDSRLRKQLCVTNYLILRSQKLKRRKHFHRECFVR